MILALSAAASFWLMNRVMVSVALPGPNGTITVIGLLG